MLVALRRVAVCVRSVKSPQRNGTLCSAGVVGGRHLAWEVIHGLVVSSVPSHLADSSLDDLSTNAVKKCSYQLAHTCIDFLMLENRVATDRVFRLPGNMAVVKRYLEFVDNGQVSLSCVHTVCQL